MTSDLRQGYARLLAELDRSGALSPDWVGPFERAPRSAFVPEEVWLPDSDDETQFHQVRRAADPDAWWAAVDADDYVVTQFDDGTDGGPGLPTSSASMPSLVAMMLRHLDVEDGHRVLDVGTGTGWTAALLCERLGDDHVVTIEVDPDLGAAAARRLNASGHSPESVIGDGLVGWPRGAPYDRIHSTASVQYVPPAWLDQTRPGGVIVTPWGTPYGNLGLARLVVGDGYAQGRFVDQVAFMWVRSQRPPSDDPLAGEAEWEGPSLIDPDLAEEDMNAVFAIGLKVPDVRYFHTWNDADPGGTLFKRLFDGHGSWASVCYRDWTSDDTVLQHGPRMIWDEVTAARLWWEELGEPELTRFGLTVQQTGEQAVWLDEPDQIVSRFAAPS